MDDLVALNNRIGALDVLGVFGLVVELARVAIGVSMFLAVHIRALALELLD